MSAHLCTACGDETVYQVFSGGREWYCPGCKMNGEYQPGQAARRAQMLQTDAGRTALRAEMDQELARMKDED